MKQTIIIMMITASVLLAACSAVPLSGAGTVSDTKGTNTAGTDTGNTGTSDTEEITIDTGKNESTAAETKALEDLDSEPPPGKIVEDQSFNVTLDGWGNVRFVSFIPDDTANGSDVNFYLMKDGKIIYTFPNYSAQDSAYYAVDSVKAVSFQDVNGDGKKDVIAIIAYKPGTGPDPGQAYNSPRIWIAGKDNRFTLDNLLCEAVAKNHADSDIRSVMDFISSQAADTGNGDSDQNPEAPATPPDTSGSVGEDEVYRLSGIHEKDARKYFEEFTDHIARDEKQAASDMILFPRKLKFPQKEIVVQDSDEFLAYYDQVFTPDFKAKLEKDIKGEIFGTYEGAAMGHGDVWITSADGRLWVETINNEGQCSVVYPGKPGVQHE